jgi:hypothetical protein
MCVNECMCVLVSVGVCVNECMCVLVSVCVCEYVCVRERGVFNLC